MQTHPVITLLLLIKTFDQVFSIGAGDLPLAIPSPGSSSSDSRIWNQPKPPVFTFPPSSPLLSSSWSDPTLLPDSSVVGVLVLEDQSECLLYKGENYVGKSPNSTVRLFDDQCDVEHCLITCIVPSDDNAATFSIEDLGSRYHTFVNGKSLTSFRTCSLETLDQLRFGNVDAQFFDLNTYLNRPE